MNKEVVENARKELQAGIEAAQKAANSALQDWEGSAADAFRNKVLVIYDKHAAELLRLVDRLIADEKE